MILKNTRNILNLDNIGNIVIMRLISRKFHMNDKIINNISKILNFTNNNNLLKNTNFKFTKNNKNLENMKFEVFKTNKGTEPKSNTIPTTTTSTLKTKLQQKEIKNKIKSDSNLKSMKNSETYKPLKNTTTSHSSTITHRQTLKENKEEVKNFTKNPNDMHTDNTNSNTSNNNIDTGNKIEAKQSLKFQETNTQSALKTEISKLNTVNSQENDEFYTIKDTSGANNLQESVKLSKESAADDYNLNEAELELLAQKDHHRFSTEESGGLANDESAPLESTNLYLSQDSLSEKESFSEPDLDSTEKTQLYSSLSLNEILNIYSSDSLYKKNFDEAKRVCICEMHSDILLAYKFVAYFQNFSSLFIVSQLFYYGFSLPSLIIYVFIKFLLRKLIQSCDKSVVKLLADPTTMRVEFYTINLYGIEVCRSYSMFQLVRKVKSNDILAYSYYKEDCFKDEFKIQEVCKIINENFFKNFFLIHTRHYENEFMFKYFHLHYLFSNKNMSENISGTPQKQESFFKNIVTYYFKNFSNYNTFLKDKINKNIENKSVDFEGRISLMCLLYCYAFIIFIIDYLVYKYVIGVHFEEVEGGIDKLYEEERKRRSLI